jgi:hypothetical protein
MVVRCHAGCSIDDVIAALGMTCRDLFPAKYPQPSQNGEALRVVSVRSQPAPQRANEESLESCVGALKPKLLFRCCPKRWAAERKEN